MKNSQWLFVLLLAGPAQPAETYRLDSANTEVSFTVQYLGIQWVSARFADINGEFVLDQTGTVGRVDVTVGIASLDCNEPRWNERLRSPEWLDVHRYPRMVFHSSTIRLGAERAIADGELTLHGLTRPMVLNISLGDCSTGTCRFSARGRIRRSDYGLPHGFWSGGDQVDIVIGGAISAGVRRAAKSDRVSQN